MQISQYTVSFFSLPKRASVILPMIAVRRGAPWLLLLDVHDALQGEATTHVTSAQSAAGGQFGKKLVWPVGGQNCVDLHPLTCRQYFGHRMLLCLVPYTSCSAPNDLCPLQYLMPCAACIIPCASCPMPHVLHFVQICGRDGEQRGLPWHLFSWGH